LYAVSEFVDWRRRYIEQDGQRGSCVKFRVWIASVIKHRCVYPDRAQFQACISASDDKSVPAATMYEDCEATWRALLTFNPPQPHADEARLDNFFHRDGKLVNAWHTLWTVESNHFFKQGWIDGNGYTKCIAATGP
jgi:hypothetical protein